MRTLRLALALSLSVAVVATTLVLNSRGLDPGGTARADALKKVHAATAQNTAENAAAAADPAGTTVVNADGTHTHVSGAPTHNHNDPATKNSISRSAPTTDETTADPTSPATAAAHERNAALQRRRRRHR